ncbi:alpha-ketoglutarate-dependent dioxygenase AlkB [Rhodanobacter sp. MP7CTX1]|uniref:alpha-ketoglutarate-dependent dioxygenase AlkB n=1 Tax=Rhodanobacter sp. MP7CTX1 TaxID=2723084 RepID=UPI0016225CC7|nr:alpha-ketoglutarate-dependent dioxygenase AlkB [Rhodanobacter sp. MP7CTX1]MBB6186079.1 alkylated DNA repair dioxygenase AlkB [Rhodanobacter sp. MP7CTX1]
MSQLSLFGTGQRRLLDDASGFIELTPDFLDATTAQSWFHWLHENVAWEAGRRLMYEREVDVPRLRAHYPSSDAQLPALLSDALERVRAAIGAPFDSIGLNLYRNQHDSVAPHNDTLADLERDQPIALLSLGATRRMTIRAKQPPRRVLQVDMESGALLLMSWSTQLHYDHSIPKQREAVGPRISLAFRVRGNPPE